MLNHSWGRAWQGIEAKGDNDTLRDELIAAYKEPQRHYHSLQHLTECLKHFEKYKNLAEYPAEVEIALWFHDAIYDVKASDNEQASADWAVKALSMASVPSTRIERVKDLILATCHNALPIGADQSLLVDIDLLILASDSHRFLQYEDQVRQEYSFVPKDVYLVKRAEVLSTFLQREAIYSTPVIRQAYEAKARANLEQSIEALKQASKLKM
jgi:predicted metal-dependent HD superfamily phosphohydrolase